NQSGGTHAMGSLDIASIVGSTGSYSMSNGATLTMTDYADVGTNGNGTFTQTGGSTTINAGNLFLGNTSSGNGAMTLSGGTLSVNYTTFIGNFGHGVFNQSGGTYTTTVLDVGVAATGTGSYSLSNGG